MARLGYARHGPGRARRSATSGGARAHHHRAADRPAALGAARLRLRRRRRLAAHRRAPAPGRRIRNPPTAWSRARPGLAAQSCGPSALRDPRGAGADLRRLREVDRSGGRPAADRRAHAREIRRRLGRRLVRRSRQSPCEAPARVGPSARVENGSMGGFRIVLRAASALLIALGAMGLAAGALAADGPPPILVGHITDEINPITARYVDRVVTEGEADGAAAVVFVIDTPGGLIDSTYQITARFLSAKVPIVTFVAPQGARAASAGTFITMAGNIAAMAPATNIGAAHPVDSSGGDIQGDLRLKAENDAVAHIVNIAKIRGRNEQWAEDAVRKSVSARVDEALALQVVDLQANDVADLLAKIDGRSVTTTAGTVTLATKNAPVNDDGLNPFETFLHFVVDPQIAVLLFTLGTYGLIFELSNPGLIFPGIIGVIAIILALFSFGTLDADGAGVALMVFALVLFVAELKVQAHGLLTAGGVAALVIGLIIVFPPFRPTFPGVRQSVEPLLVLFVVGLTAIFFGVALRTALRPLPIASGASLLLGAVGVAKTDVTPRGIAHVAGEDWTVVSEGGDIPKGGPVRVKRVDGVRLIVEPARGAEGKGAA